MADKTELQGLKVVELRERCNKHNLETKGLKSVLVSRLAKFYSEQAKISAEKEKENGTTTKGADEEERFQGTVKSWTKRGYGFIEVQTSEGDSNVEIFVHRNDLVMEKGEEPQLRKGMQVQFKEVENSSETSSNGAGTHAEEVTGHDGTPISWWKKCGDTDRTILETVHAGVIGEFRYKERYGYVLLQEPVTHNGKEISICEKLHVKRRDVCLASSASKPDLRAGRRVKFKIYEDQHGKKGFGATFVTDIDGEPFNDDRLKIEKGDEELDTETRYQGRVLQFKVNNYGFISCDEDLQKFGVETKLYFQAADIQTSESPAYVAVGSVVSFTLYKDKRGLGAKNVAMPDGSDLVVPDGLKYKPYSEIMPRESYTEKYLGKVQNFQWDRGFGYIKLDQTDTVPEEQKNDLKNGAVYFHWNDIKSSDKIVGINKDVAVQFNLYKDEKGLGAENITTADGEPISGQEKKRGRSWRNRPYKRKHPGDSWGYPWKKRSRGGMRGGMFGVYF